MTIRRAGHATVVAYVALFAALGSSAIAARDDSGAKELKTPIMREKTVSVDAYNTRGTADVICRPKEQFLSGGGYWVGGAPLGEEPSLSGITFARKDFDRPARGIVLTGTKPGARADQLVAQALCLPK